VHANPLSVLITCIALQLAHRTPVGRRSAELTAFCIPSFLVEFEPSIHRACSSALPRYFLCRPIMLASTLKHGLWYCRFYIGRYCRLFSCASCHSVRYTRHHTVLSLPLAAFAGIGSIYEFSCIEWNSQDIAENWNWRRVNQRQLNRCKQK